MSTAAPRRRRPLQVILGVVLVALAFVGVLVVARLSGAPAQKISIVNAATNIQLGKKIVAEDLVISQVDAPGPPGGLRDKAGAIGKLARQGITAGDPVLDSELAAEIVAAPARLYFSIPAGKVALNIPAGDISPYVQPGNQIDVIATPKVASSTQIQETKTTLKGLLVLAVGAPGTAATGSATGSGGNLVVEVSLQDAEALQFIVKNTDFTYVLKSPQDATNPDPSTNGVDLPTFKQAFGFR